MKRGIAVGLLVVGVVVVALVVRHQRATAEAAERRRQRITHWHSMLALESCIAAAEDAVATYRRNSTVVPDCSPELNDLLFDGDLPTGATAPFGYLASAFIVLHQNLSRFDDYHQNLAYLNLQQLLERIRAVRAGKSLPAIREYMLSIANTRAVDDPVRWRIRLGVAVLALADHLSPDERQKRIAALREEMKSAPAAVQADVPGLAPRTPSVAALFAPIDGDHAPF